MKIAFVGAGIMGHGMICNLLAAGHQVSIKAHSNRKPIIDLANRGATEAKSSAELARHAEALIICVTNSNAVEEVISELTPHLSTGILVIDCTTNEPNAPARFAQKLANAGLLYIEAPVTGGVTQAAEGTLGAIVGCLEEHFDQANKILSCFCKQVERFGDVGMGARTKLVSNFLALGTATLVVETFKQARALGVDWQKLYGLAKLGSGNSSAMHRIMDAALEDDFQGYVFTVQNTLKDLTYINKLLHDEGISSDLAQAMKGLYEESVTEGSGDQMLSERLAKD
jgi:3-hydroxyisobutyrate dehydrogenase-like beta-hydroxyacid dehydrogenase